MRQTADIASRQIVPSATTDGLRGIAMVVVLVGHALEVYFIDRPDGLRMDAALAGYKLLSTFPMALFFLVSGMAATEIARRPLRRAVQVSVFLAVLAYLVHLMGIAINLSIATGHRASAVVETLRYGLVVMLKGRDFSTVVVWFLVSLACVRLIVYAIARRWGTSGRIAAIAICIAVSAAMPLMPNLFMMKTWATGTAFFLLGMVAGPVLARIPLRIGLAALALWPVATAANHGCPFDFVASCPQTRLGDASVTWLHAGDVGNIPLFYLSAMLGCMGAIAIVKLLQRVALDGGLVWIGHRTLELLVINGFVLTYVQPWLKTLPEPEHAWIAIPTAVAMAVVGHVALLIVLRRPLALLQRTALRIADWIMRRLVHLPILGRMLSEGPRQRHVATSPG